MNLRDILSGIYADRGELTPEVVVEEARPRGAPLHHRFEWDNKKAGEAYRLAQARELIRECTVEHISEATGEKHFIRAFSSLHRAGSTDRQGYAPTDEIMHDPLLGEILLRTLRRELEDIRRRYGHMAEFRTEVQHLTEPTG